MKTNSWSLLNFSLGEEKGVRYEMMTKWWHHGRRLHSFLVMYDLDDIYNADEFGLFYKALPNKSLHLG